MTKRISQGDPKGAGLVATAPECIFLQACGDCQLFGLEHCNDCDQKFSSSEDVTWCGDRVFDSDIKYLRHDLVVRMLRECIQSPAGVAPETVELMLEEEGGGVAVSRQDELAS